MIRAKLAVTAAAVAFSLSSVLGNSSPVVVTYFRPPRWLA